MRSGIIDRDTDLWISRISSPSFSRPVGHFLFLFPAIILEASDLQHGAKEAFERKQKRKEKKKRCSRSMRDPDERT